MPLESGSSRETVNRNISEMERSGHTHRQAVAAALNNARKKHKKRRKKHHRKAKRRM